MTFVSSEAGHGPVAPLQSTAPFPESDALLPESAAEKGARLASPI